MTDHMPAFRASDREMRYVGQDLAAGRDPLDLASRSDLPCSNDIVVGRSLSGVHETTRERLVAALAERGMTTLASVDELTARMIAHAGVDPLVATWLASISFDSAEVQNGDGVALVVVDLASAYDDPGSLNRVEIGADTAWFSKGMLTMPCVPETLVQVLTGGPLTALVTHPVLDSHPFVIDAIHNGGDRCQVHVSFENQWIDIRPLTIQRLAEVMPAIEGKRD